MVNVLRKMKDAVSRLIWRDRWQRLDMFTYVWVNVGLDAQSWRQRAEQAVGESRWRFNYLAALAEQIVANAKAAFRAGYRHDDAASAVSWGKVVRDSRKTWELM